MVRRVLSAALIALTALGLVLPATRTDAAAQYGGITLSVDRGQNASYTVGDNINVTYSLPGPGYTRLTSTTPAGTRLVEEGYKANPNGVIRTTVGDPPGRRTLRMELFQGSQVVASGETSFYAVAPGGGGGGGGGGGSAACNGSTQGTLNGLGDQNRYTFFASAGTRISATAAQIQIMIYPPPPTATLRVSLLAPSGYTLNSGNDTLPETVVPQDGQYTVVVEVAGLNGAQNRAFSYTLNLNCAGGGNNPPPPPGGITYQAGWNLVGGPTGTTFPVQLFQFDPAANQYRTVPAGQPVQAGQGYWAYFNAPVQVSLSGLSQTVATVQAPATAWVQVANPSATQNAIVTGADAVYTWDPAANQYGTGNVLRPGQGAWAIRYTTGAITISAQ